MDDSRLDMLADLLAGEGSEHDVDTVADSPELSAALIDLEAAQAAVAADLARLPRPVVPAGLEDRIAAALAAAGPYAPHERVPVAVAPGSDAGRFLQDEVPSSHVTGHPPVKVVPLRRPHAAGRNPWPLRAAAAVVLVAVGGLAVAVLPRGGDSADQPAASSSGAASGAASGEMPAVPTNNSGTDYAASPGLLQAALPTLIGGAALARSTAASSRGDATKVQPVVPSPAPKTLGSGASAGPETSQGSLASQDSGTSQDPATTPDPVLDRLRRPAQLAGCLSALAPKGVRLVPAALDYAAWGGKPALVVLVASPPQSVQRGYDVFVVGANCRSGNDDTLHFERIPA